MAAKLHRYLKKMAANSDIYSLQVEVVAGHLGTCNLEYKCKCRGKVDLEERLFQLPMSFKKNKSKVLATEI